MTNKARFRVNGNGSSVLPITGGTDTFTTKPLAEDYERIYFSLVFYTDSTLTTKATPTTGTVSFFASDDSSECEVAGGFFGASDVYNVMQPAATGSFDGARIVFEGVDSGLYARAWVTQKGDGGEN